MFRGVFRSFRETPAIAIKDTLVCVAFGGATVMVSNAVKKHQKEVDAQHKAQEKKGPKP